MKRNYTKGKICCVRGCLKKPIGLDLCNAHYKKHRKYGDPEAFKVITHGCTGTPEHGVWLGMRKRCYQKTSISYKHYGGRGITICERWKDNFLSFLEDMGERPSNKHQIDRIDNDGNYSPDNCEWVTCKKNNQHKSNTKLTQEIVNNIRRDIKRGDKIKDVAKNYSICERHVRDIKNYRRW